MHDDIPLAVPELSRPPGQPDRWLGVAEPRWELYYALVYLACVAIVEAGSLTPHARTIATVALALMVPWYLLMGRPVMGLEYETWTNANGSWRAVLYLTGLIALFAVTQSQETNAWFLAFALSPQYFQVAGVKRGLLYVVIFNVTGAVLLAMHVRGAASKVLAVGIAVFAISFSWVFSRWTLQVVERSVERQSLIDQLLSTRAELAAANREAGVLAERQRLAGEIHDTLAQGFTSIVTLIQAADAALGTGVPASARRHLEMALGTARENLAEARALVGALSPARLASGSLGDAVGRVAEAAGAELGIVCAVEVTGAARPLPTGTEVVLLRVCQEALANVRKHAAASGASVRLRYAEECVTLEVADDGRGFDATVVNGGYGLRGMRQRVSQAGGTISVSSAPGSGTMVLAEVPA